MVLKALMALSLFVSASTSSSPLEKVPGTPQEVGALLRSSMLSSKAGLAHPCVPTVRKKNPDI